MSKITCVRSEECRIARADETVRNVLVNCTKPGRRTGAIMLTDDAGRLVGLFTDSDLARSSNNATTPHSTDQFAS